MNHTFLSSPPKTLSCDWSLQFMKVISQALNLSLFRINVLSKLILRPGWRQVHQYKCAEAGVQLSINGHSRVCALRFSKNAKARSIFNFKARLPPDSEVYTAQMYTECTVFFQLG